MSNPNCLNPPPNSEETPQTSSPVDIPSLFDNQIDVNNIQSSNPAFPNTYNTFFVISAIKTERNFRNISVFKLNKFINTDIGVPKSISFLRDGSLLVEAFTKEQALKIASLKILGTFHVEVAPHKTLNTCKGVVYSHDLKMIEEKEIVEELASQKVTEVKRIMTRRDGALTPSPLHILTFNATVLPEFVFVGFIRIKVDLHVPNPMRCLNCQRYGHTQHTCGKEATCGRCGGAGAHRDAPCDLEPRCVNCSGSHPSWSRDCQTWKREKKIIEIKTQEKIPYPEARRKYSLLSPTQNLVKSFAQATKPQEKEASATPSELKRMMDMMAQILEGQDKTKKQLNEQTKRIEEQTEQIKKLREENEELKNKNNKMEKELVKLRRKQEQAKPEPAGRQKGRSERVAVEGSQESLEDSADMDCSFSEAIAASRKGGSKKQRITYDVKQLSRSDFLKKS
jgi:cell division protein FtsB